MHFILQGVWEAIRLLFSGDSTTYEIALRSLEISAAALAVNINARTANTIAIFAYIFFDIATLPLNVVTVP